MLHIFCPHCGELRSEEEFHASGQAHIPRPLDPNTCTDEEWGVYMSDERPTGFDDAALAIRLQLDGSDLDRKLTALAAMATQTRDAMAAIGPDLYAAQAAVEAFVDACTLPRFGR